MAKLNQDFDYFVKGLDGYVQHMQTIDQITKKDELPEMETGTEHYEDVFVSTKPNRWRTINVDPLVHPPKALTSKSTAKCIAQELKNRGNLVKGILLLIGFWLVVFFLFR